MNSSAEKASCCNRLTGRWRQAGRTWYRLAATGSGTILEHKDTLAHLTAHAARLLANQLREALAPLGLLPAQFTAMMEIAAAEGLTQKQLVERLELEQPGVARTLAGLERSGWIERRPGASGRSPGLYLTAGARQLLPRAAAAAAELDARAGAALSRTERAWLADDLRMLIETLREG